MLGAGEQDVTVTAIVCARWVDQGVKIISGRVIVVVAVAQQLVERIFLPLLLATAVVLDTLARAVALV